VNADEVYIDPSALLALYLHSPRSRILGTWRAQVRGALSITRFGHAELVNAVALARFRDHISAEEFTRALAHVSADFADGDLRFVDLLWRAALDRAAEISRQYVPDLGVRSQDVLHVASALELGVRLFVTYDERQARLAQACGLKVVRP
jgi:predicted nucleic acid-binding protein